MDKIYLCENLHWYNIHVSAVTIHKDNNQKKQQQNLIQVDPPMPKENRETGKSSTPRIKKINPWNRLILLFPKKNVKLNTFFSGRLIILDKSTCFTFFSRGLEMSSCSFHVFLCKRTGGLGYLPVSLFSHRAGDLSWVCTRFMAFSRNWGSWAPVSRFSSENWGPSWV